MLQYLYIEVLQYLYIEEVQYLHFQFDHLCSVTTYDIIFCCCRPVYYIIIFSKYSPVARISIQNLTRLVPSLLWLQNSIDQAVS